MHDRGGFDEARGQLVAEFEGQKRLLDRPGRPLDQQLQAPRLGRVEFRRGWDLEDVQLDEARRIAGGDPAQPLVIPVEEAHRAVTLDQLDADLQPVGSFSFETGLEAPLQIRYLDESPDKQFLLVSAWADGENWILLLDQNVVVWKFQLPQELNGVQFRSNFGTAFYFSANEIQMVTIAQEGGKQGLYLIELSQQSGMPGTIRPLVTDLTNFHRIRRIRDRFLVEGYFEESGEYRPYNDLYPALALLDQDFNQYWYWHLDASQYRNVVVSNNSDHLYILNSEGNSYYQTVEQLDIDGATLDKWRIRDEAAIFHVEMEENGDFLILGQMDRTNEYGQNDAAYFIRSKAEDPFAAFY